MSNIKTFKVSDKLFQGYTVNMDLNYYETVDDISTEVKNRLIQKLEENNFEILAEEAKKRNFHIHDFDIAVILIADKEVEFWVCSHC